MAFRVIYSPDREAFREVCPDPEIYLAPRQRLPLIKPVVPCPLVALEDVTETSTRLWLAEAVRDGTRVVYDRVARHYNVGSDKARVLARLAEVAHVCMVDIVPFHEHRQHLYMTWRYISRSILGYQHYYAFAGGHWEREGDGIVHSLDERLLAAKVAPHVARCDTDWLRPATMLRVEPTAEEAAAYRAERERLFAAHKTPQPIVTRLADTVHAFASRREAVGRLLGPNVAVVCNIASYAAHYARLGASVGTYAKPPKNLSTCQRVVFAEPPIVNAHRRADLQSEIGPDAEIVDVVGGCKVDDYLSGKTAAELTDMARFCGALRACLSPAKRP